MNENVSCFIDGELDQAESERLITQLDEDKDLREQWRRYNIYGSAIRNELSPVLSSDFSDRVLRALANEPVQLAPASLGRRTRLRGPLAGLAVAASLIGIAILLQKPALQETQEKQVSTVAELSAPVTAPAPAPLLVQQDAPAPDTMVGKNQEYDLIVANSKNENIRERINRLLIEHNEYNPASDMTGIWSYSHFVGYNPRTDSH
ncbi:MAG: sigma-E factor negative regulatory protein [Gammaproteobacteria bacterium]|nr:sigma-E factor negative regulatory protein [Gammaproteobacteria bacterium]